MALGMTTLLHHKEIIRVPNAGPHQEWRWGLLVLVQIVGVLSPARARDLGMHLVESTCASCMGWAELLLESARAALSFRPGVLCFPETFLSSQEDSNNKDPIKQCIHPGANMQLAIQGASAAGAEARA